MRVRLPPLVCSTIIIRQQPDQSGSTCFQPAFCSETQPRNLCHVISWGSLGNYASVCVCVGVLTLSRGVAERRQWLRGEVIPRSAYAVCQNKYRLLDWLTGITVWGGASVCTCLSVRECVQDWCSFLVLISFIYKDETIDPYSKTVC